jgi:Ran GTPase-activating protein (RanGAP) involved in mRNA processing and transport
LSANEFGGRLPRSLGNCGKLKVLDLSCNAFHGNVPATLGRLLDLNECRLSDNRLTGERFAALLLRDGR